MTTTLKHTLASLALSLTATGAAAAGVQHYDEAMHGDLVHAPGQVHKVFDLIDGVNIVAGQYGGTPGLADFDAFSFRVPVGLRLDSLSLELWEENGEAIDASSWTLRRHSLTQGEGDLLGQWVLPSPSVHWLELDQAAGDFNLMLSDIAFAGGAEVPRQFGRWGMILRASPDEAHRVPLPGSLLLAVTGLALLRLRRA